MRSETAGQEDRGTRATPARAVVLARRPMPGDRAGSCLEVVAAAVPPCPPDGVVIATELLSCDPYQRLRMADTYRIGEVVPARAVGRVTATRSARWQVGDLVWGPLAWATHVAADGAHLHRVEEQAGPVSQALTVGGIPGLTAYVGMCELGRPVAGRTVVVSGAAGAVGSIAGQLALLAGARVIGIVGSPAKARFLVEELGFHAAVLHRAGPPLEQALAEAAPDGVDLVFENVGGPVLDASLAVLRAGARVVLCGMVAGYEEPDGGAVHRLMAICGAGATVHGLNVADHAHRLETVSHHLLSLVQRGLLKAPEVIVSGIEHLPDAFDAMLGGGGIGKRLVRVHPREGEDDAGRWDG